MTDLERIESKLDQILDWQAEHQEVLQHMRNVMNDGLSAYKELQEKSNAFMLVHANKIQALKNLIDDFTKPT